ncbi:hypothetical protein [Sphingomonas jatrophae]|uniref:DUF885 domain-containing protein n=1 Tax=Sphingomonas jatrophae TaxID=1166337 RepID=A0A1I6KAF2_9SPHN|nr:hypothetical protein [Sphingomonas jatrophae]SFR88201.1 hypothetical protein SAMN05192580_1505 [Sphingomonas jatrophae]
MSASSSDTGTELTAVTMGIDRFERDHAKGDSLLDGEGLVPIYIGDDLVEPRSYAAWEEVFGDLDALATRPDVTADDARGVFLQGMIRSVRTAARLFSGEQLSYAEKVRDLVGAEAAPTPEARIAELSDELDSRLTAAGFVRGDLRARTEAWEEARAVPSEKLEGTFRELMAIAKQRTADMIFDTADYDMQLKPLRGVPFTARCGFIDRRMDLNVDNAFSRAALKHLVAHEVYPGHATQLLYTRAEAAAGRSPADALLCTANAVTGCVQEGIGDQGVELIDWIEDDDDALHLALRSLKSAVQTTAAWRLMQEGEAADTVADYMRTVGCGQEAWVQGRLRMASHPFRGPFVPSYFAGNESVRRVREAVSEAQRPAFLHHLYAQVHSPESLEMFPIDAKAAA